MRKYTNIFLLIGLILLSISCGSSTSNQATESKEAVVSIDTAAIHAIQYESLFEKFQQQNDTLYVVNFWATWCLPCVKELPEFMIVNKNFQGNAPYKMILVSLDPVSALQEKVKPFIIEKQLGVQHYLLDDINRSNEWMKKIDPSWTGSIPATVLYKNGQPLSFTEGTLTETELTALINQHLTK